MITGTEEQYFSPPEVAKLLRVGHCKVLSWIHNEELAAIDVSEGRQQRPRWRISCQDLENFLARRATSPPSKSRRRRHRKRDDVVIEFFK